MQPLIRFAARFALAFLFAASCVQTALADADLDLPPDALGPPVAAYPESDIVWMLRLGTFDEPVPVTIEALNGGGPMQWSPNCGPRASSTAAGTIAPGTAYLCLRTVAGGVNYPFQYRITLGVWQAVAQYASTYTANPEHVQIVTGPNPVTSSTTATFTLFANDNPVFECSLVGSDFVA